MPTQVPVKMEVPEKKEKVWNEERIEELKKLWAEKLSASEIATKLGAGLTRNAVIGKLHRLGLLGRGNGPDLYHASRKVAEKKETRRPSQVREVKSAQKKPLPISFLKLLPLTVTESKDGKGKYTILHLSEKTCKWPIGNPNEDDFAFVDAAPEKVHRIVNIMHE